MLPLLTHQHNLPQVYLDYLHALEQTDFSGDIDSSYKARLVQATDNSVYQFLPQSVLFPRSTADIQIALALADEPEFSDITFSARGGGTGTNGQSLTNGLVMDLSRYMTNIIEINPDECWVRVEAGVVKDALNDALREHGFFFSPDLSTSNRATIGGMINTDASGAGSLVYGKTSDHVLTLTSVLIDGSVLRTETISKSQALDMPTTNLADIITQQVAHMCLEQRSLIEAQFPPLNRFLTGYDLKHVWNDELSQFNLARMLTGSEGTLAIISEAKLNITPIPKYRTLINIKYDSFESALRHAPSLVEAKATVVETIDSKVLNLAKQDIIWHSVAPLIEDVENATIDGLNMVEFAGEQVNERQKIELLQQKLDQQIANGEFGVLGYQVTDELASINRIYAMRKKAVGLLGATKGQRKPIAFAEDTAVPPEKLADFIMEFRALLDSHQLQYGMFGHVDAGVLHVRPALDMCDPNDEQLLKTVSDQVAQLTLKYGGLMWGEHGKGVRGEYGPAVFGEQLFATLGKIKALFDPQNKLNPGKLVTPNNLTPLAFNVDSIKRGYYDRQIPVMVREQFPDVMNCNGNGLCFNYSHLSPMCPSFKVSGDRTHSPKGRAGLMREWLRLLSEKGIDVEQLVNEKSSGLLQRLKNSYSQDYDFSHEVMQSMQGCLACKACSGQCPVKVDVPKFRADFYHIYYKRYQRPIKDYLVAGVEDSVTIMAKAPKVANALTQNKLSQWLIKKSIGYVDTPALSVPTLRQRLDSHPCLGYDLASIMQISAQERDQHVIIIQDPFNSFYDAELIFHFVELIELLGFKPILLPFKPNGKPAHIKGFLDKFAKTAQSSADLFNQLAATEIPMVGIDCYRAVLSR